MASISWSSVRIRMMFGRPAANATGSKPANRMEKRRRIFMGFGKGEY
jgi:hypothetical protein